MTFTFTYLMDYSVGRGQLKCVGTRAETRFCLSAKRTSPFKSAGASVQSTTGSRGVRISGSNAGYTMFRGSVKGTGYPLHSPVSPSLPLPCVTVCHHISTGVFKRRAPYKVNVTIQVGDSDMPSVVRRSMNRWAFHVIILIYAVTDFALISSSSAPGPRCHSASR